jgi:hypothetical protein
MIEYNNMKNRTTSKILIENKEIYRDKSARGWAIVVMPDEIRVDNYHGFTHIHLSLDGDKIPIKYSDRDEVFVMIREHIIKNKNIIKKELLEELL